MDSEGDIMKTLGIFLLVVLATVASAVLYGLHLKHHGFSAREEPSEVEILAARTMRNMAIPRSARTEENPWKGLDTPENLKAAREHFGDHCAECHANDGSGKTEMGQNLYPKAPDMRLAATQDLTDGELYYIIRNGVALTGMPAWGNPNLKRDDESWHLVVFIRHLPALTADELDGMKKLNPKTEADRAEEQQEEEFLNG